MISIVICSINSALAKKCTESIKKTATLPHEIILIDNKKNNEGLSKVYNAAAQQVKEGIIVFVHEDVEFLTQGWDATLVSLFENKDVGVVGVAGTNYLLDIGSWVTAGQPFIKGQVVMPTKEHAEEYQLDKFSEQEGTFPVVALDGLFMATTKDIMNTIQFDEKNFDKFDFYDVDFSLRVAQHHTVLVTTDILLLHNSGGRFGNEWKDYQEKFKEKHYGTLPYTNQDKKPDLHHLQQWNAYPYAL